MINMRIITINNVLVNHHSNMNNKINLFNNQESMHNLRLNYKKFRNIITIICKINKLLIIKYNNKCQEMITLMGYNKN